MKRKIESLERKLYEYLLVKRNFNIIMISFIIVVAMIFFVISLKINKPIEVTTYDVEYSRGIVNELVDSDFIDGMNIINKMENKGYFVDYENSEIIISFAEVNKGKIIFSELTDNKVPAKISYLEAKQKCIEKTIIFLFLGALLGFVIFLIFECILYKKMHVRYFGSY